MLREFASKRHVKLSRVTIRAKDDEEEEEEEKVKPAATKHRRRRARGGERKESDRSLAKVMRQTEEPEPEPGQPSSGPSTPDHGDAAADLDAELEAALLLGQRRAARQWRPALQSIAEG